MTTPPPRELPPFETPTPLETVTLETLDGRIYTLPKYPCFLAGETRDIHLMGLDGVSLETLADQTDYLIQLAALFIRYRGRDRAFTLEDAELLPDHALEGVRALYQHIQAKKAQRAAQAGESRPPGLLTR